MTRRSSTRSKRPGCSSTSTSRRPGPVARRGAPRGRHRHAALARRAGDPAGRRTPTRRLAAEPGRRTRPSRRPGRWRRGPPASPGGPGSRGADRAAPPERHRVAPAVHHDPTGLRRPAAALGCPDYGCRPGSTPRAGSSTSVSRTASGTSRPGPTSSARAMSAACPTPVGHRRRSRRPDLPTVRAYVTKHGKLSIKVGAGTDRQRAGDEGPGELGDLARRPPVPVRLRCARAREPGS